MGVLFQSFGFYAVIFLKFKLFLTEFYNCILMALFLTPLQWYSTRLLCAFVWALRKIQVHQHQICSSGEGGVLLPLRRTLCCGFCGCTSAPGAHLPRCECVLLAWFRGNACCFFQQRAEPGSLWNGTRAAVLLKCVCFSSFIIEAAIRVWRGNWLS